MCTASKLQFSREPVEEMSWDAALVFTEALDNKEKEETSNRDGG
jgi:hypothetical protein